MKIKSELKNNATKNVKIALIHAFFLNRCWLKFSMERHVFTTMTCWNFQPNYANELKQFLGIKTKSKH